ncbi:DUF4235 domain-containing protein [Cellulomonas sp. NPDC057328]|uniref:DUF4235 domain-containing protein n=1 Tax=Cellulomonas sp. NPDC057328 TaxID=3346101 RepID=UPI003635ECDA
MGDNDKSMVAKLVGMGVTLGAAWVAHRVVELGWEKARGHKPPAPDSTDDDINFSEVAVAAVITGAVVALSRVLATRGAAKLIAR